MFSVRSLDEVLATPSGRRLWREFVQNEIARENTSPHRRERPPPTGERGSCSTSEGSTLDTTARPPPSRPPTTPRDDPSPPTQEDEAAPPAGRSQTAEIPSTASLSKGGGKDEQLSSAGRLGPTALREAGADAGTGRSEMATGDGHGGGVMSDSPYTVAKLHLALESLARPGGGEGAGRVDPGECAQFCAEWPKDCQLPDSFDRTLLEPAWSGAEQVTLRKRSSPLGIVRGQTNTFANVTVKIDIFQKGLCGWY